MSFGQDWGTLAWTTDGTLNAASIANNASSDSGAISNDGKLDTEVSVEIAYGATASAGAVVYVLREVGGSGGNDYESRDDLPWGFEMPRTVSTTHVRTFTVPASIGRFKIQVFNNAVGASITATVRYRQAAGENA